MLSYAELDNLQQPPYGDRAIDLRHSAELIGVCGFVPCLGPYRSADRYTAEVGLYWAIAPAHQRQGHAAEAGQALVAFAFDTLHLARLIATTSFDNSASIGVMRKLGMRIVRYAGSDPDWLQVVGVLER